MGISLISVGPVLDAVRGSTELTASLAYSRFLSNSWSLQGGLGGSWFGPPLGPFRAEVGAAISGSDYPGGSGTDHYDGLIRLHWLREGWGLWAGGSVGGAWDGIRHRADNDIELGGWLRRGQLTAAATVTPNFLGPLRFTDFQAVGRLVRGPLELTAVGGLRAWSRPSAPGSGWAGLTGVYWLREHLAVTAAVGSYPADYAEGNPQGRYVTLGLRLATRRSPRPTSELEGAAVLRPSLVRPVVPRFEVTSSSDGAILTLSAPNAHRVEVMGDFTNWRPVELHRRENSWSVSLPIPPGVHRFNIRVDGGAWGVPPGVPVLTDDFGGVVALLTVE